MPRFGELAVIGTLIALAAACSSSASTPGGDGNGDAGDQNPPDQDGAAPADDGATPPGTDGSTPPGQDGSTPPPGRDAGGPVIVTSPVQIIVEPSDDAEALVAAIKAATTSVHMTMYLLDDRASSTRSSPRTARGRDVKVILNETFPTGRQHQPERVQHAAVGAASRSSGRLAGFTLTHEKCVIIDGTTRVDHDDERSNTSSPNDEPRVPRGRQRRRRRRRGRGDLRGRLRATSRSRRQRHPRGRARSTRATSSSRSSTRDRRRSTSRARSSATYDRSSTALVARAAGAASTVRVVVSDATPTRRRRRSAVGAAQGAHGVQVVQASNAVHPRQGDGRRTATRAFVGSENFTAGSLGYNRELGVMTADPTALGQLETAINTDFKAGTAL